MLNFDVKYQTLTKADDTRLVSHAQSYPEAVFNFLTDEWAGITKTALFTRVGSSTTYKVILAENKCLIPSEVLADGAGQLKVSVFGGMRVTTNTVTVDIYQSGYTSGTAPSNPTPTVYEQIVDKYNELLNFTDGSFINVAGRAAGYHLNYTKGEYIEPRDGTVKTSSTWMATGYIELDGAEYINVGTDLSDARSVYNCFYDENLEYITSFRLCDNTIKVPANAKCFRVSIAQDAVAYVSPYVPNNLYLKQLIDDLTLRVKALEDK